jgi:hypothetical protein
VKVQVKSRKALRRRPGWVQELWRSGHVSALAAALSIRGMFRAMCPTPHAFWSSIRLLYISTPDPINHAAATPGTPVLPSL